MINKYTLCIYIFFRTPKFKPNKVKKMPESSRILRVSGQFSDRPMIVLQYFSINRRLKSVRVTLKLIIVKNKNKNKNMVNVR